MVMGRPGASPVGVETSAPARVDIRIQEAWAERPDVELAVRGGRPSGLGAPEVEQADLAGGARLDGDEVEPLL